MKKRLIIKQSFPIRISSSFKAFLLRFQAEQHKRIKQAIEAYQTRLEYLASLELRQDVADWEQELERMITELGLTELAYTTLQTRLREAGDDVRQHIYNQLVTVVTDRRIPIVRGSASLPENRAIIESWSKEAVRLVQKMTDDERQRIASIISNEFRLGGDITSAQKQIRQALNVSKKRAELIAQNEIGNLYGQLEKRNQENIGIRYYEWDTRLDERVRPSHKVMQGKLCRWDDPTVYKDSYDDTEWKPRSAIGGVQLHPSMDIRCRCHAGAVIEIDGEVF